MLNRLGSTLWAADGRDLARLGVLVSVALVGMVLVSPLARAALGDAPEVTEPSVSEITTTSVVVETTVNPNGLETDVAFEIRLASDPEWQNIGFEPAGDGADPVTLTESSVGSGDLDPDTAYFVRIVAQNETGETISNEVGFSTLPPLPPDAGVPSVSDVTNDAATLTADVDPNGTSSSYHFEYQVVGVVDWISVPDSDVDVGNGPDPIEVSRRVTGLEASTEYAVRLVATNQYGSDTSGEENFETLAPAAPLVSIPSLTDVTSTGARFTGKVDPNGEDGASYHFEYRQIGAPGWIGAPDPEGAVSGFTPTHVAESVAALLPDTGYQVRFVATGVGGTTTSPERGFTTRAAVAPPVSVRRYEQVSPRDKEDSELIPSEGFALPSESGDRLAFDSFGQGAFAGSPTTAATYVAQRGATQWATEAIAPFAAPAAPPRFRQFTSDLSRALLTALDPPALAPGDNPDVVDLFLRDAATASFELVTTAEASQGADGFSSADPRFAWASTDLEHVLFSTTGTTYVPGAPENAAYRASNGVVSVVSVMPSSGDAFETAGAGAGLQTVGNLRPISEDGSRIYFTAPRSANVPEPVDGAQLYVRKDHGEAGAGTVHVSAPEPGVADPTGTWAAFFRGASTDGSVAFFTSCQKLTADSTADASGGFGGRCSTTESEVTKSDLYLYDVEAGGGAGELVDLTTADPTGADVQGVVGISESGSRVYFVARGDLGGAALAGQPNLYLWQQGEGVTHIATLAEADSEVWLDPINWNKDSRITPDGSVLAFASRARLTAFDNAATSQVYLHDVSRPGELVCASCATSGGPPSAGSTIRNQAAGIDNRSAATERRNLAADGSRVFFETAEPLVAGDVNGKIDVYEYDVAAAGVALVSSGQSASPSYFAGATPDGEDAFFWTRERLVGWDQDSLNDIYDARVGGGFPEPPPAQPDCGLDCQGPISPPPALPSIGSISFGGDGNVPLLPDPVTASVRVKRLEAVRGSAARLRVRVPGAGRIRVAGSRVRRTSRSASKAGTYSVKIALRPRAKRLLRKRNRLKVRARVVFRSKNGQSASKTIAVTFKQPKAKRAKATKGGR